MEDFYSIKVNSLPLKDVVEDIANALKATVTESCEEYRIEIPSRFGKGSIKGINFEGGLGLLEYNCTFNTNFEIQFIVGDVHPLKFIYCRQGSLSHSFENTQKKHTLEKYQNSIVASKNHNGHILKFKAGEHTIVNSLEIDRIKFLPKMDCEVKTLNKNFKNLLMDVKAKKEFFYKGFYSLELADIFEKEVPFSKNDFLHKIVMEGRSYQILAHQVFQYEEDLHAEANRDYIPKGDVEQVKKAAQIIEEELADSPTIQQLSRRVGIAENKLQQGFQNYYGFSINGFVQEKRLEFSRRLLKNTDYTIGEISDIVGISSKSYFSKTFKAKYGVSPSDFRKKLNT